MNFEPNRFFTGPQLTESEIKISHFKVCVMNCIMKCIIQRSKKWLVRGLVKFATAVARLVCPDLLG